MVDIQTVGGCKKCDSDSVTCKYNFFRQGDLEIHSWEHKCLDCGHRLTTAFRSDDEDIDFAAETVDRCPYCQRQGHQSSK
ncbi:MAG: hypothetical protein VX776_08920 [Planctomycetota bacterium]|nr:hypothetical protein [Planctomycetota bacterium]